MDEKIIYILKQIKKDHGENIFQNKNKFNALFSDYSKGQYKGEINLLNITLTLGLYNEIKTTSEEYSKIRRRYIMKLRTEYFLTEDQAAFAVDIWGRLADKSCSFYSVLASEEIKIDTDKEAQSDLRKELIPAKQNGMWGYMDKMGSIIIKPIYDQVLYFSEDLAGVKLNNKWGYIDKYSKMVIMPTYYEAWSFSEGLARVKISAADKYGYIDKMGSTVIIPIYDDTLNFSEGFAGVKLRSEWGYIDKSGTMVIKSIYEYARSFSQGFAKVRLYGEWFYIDKNGRRNNEPEYI